MASAGFGLLADQTIDAAIGALAFLAAVGKMYFTVPAWPPPLFQIYRLAHVAHIVVGGQDIDAAAPPGLGYQKTAERT